MRIVQRTFLYLMSIGLIAAGAAVAAYPYSPQVAVYANKIGGSWMICLLLGCALCALGLFTLLPFDRFTRKKRSISFAGPTGTVAIQIDPFETSLRKTIAKLPMVKRVNVSVTPKDNDRKVGIETAVSLKKPSDTSTRETAERLREFIDKVARQILGADEVISVDVRVEDVLIDPTQTAESLNSIFASAEKSVAPVQRTVTPAASSAAIPSTVTPSAAVPAIQELNTHDYAIESHAETDADVAESHSSDLLTYDEAEELQRAGTSYQPASPEPKSDDDELPGMTSFESLADNSPDDSTPRDNDEEQKRETV